MSGIAERRLAELIDLQLDTVEVEPQVEYRIAGVYGFGRGVFGRAAIMGAETRYTRLNRLRSGMLVMSRLKAFEGAIAVVPEEFDGWFVSQEFPTFRCRAGAIDARYLSLICRWPEFWTRLAASSKGIGARRERVNAEQLLNVSVPLVPLDEQSRIAERFESLQARATATLQLADRADLLTSALCSSMALRLDLDDDARLRAGWRPTALSDLMALSSEQVDVDFDGSYPIAGIYSFGRGLIDRGIIRGRETSYKSFTRLATGDVVVSKLNGWEGAVAVVPPEFDGYCVSSEYPVFKLDEFALLPGYFEGVARSPAFWAELDRRTRGSMVRRRRINPAEFLSAEIWAPPIEDQQRVAQEIGAIAPLPQRREDVQTRLYALVPAALNKAFSELG